METDPRIPLAPDGYPLIGGCLGAAAVLFLAAALASGAVATALLVLATASLVGAGFFVNFFRDPHRETPCGEALVVSPADGKVIAVERDGVEPRFLRGPAAKISVFMSPLDVHVNRAPVDGEVVAVHYNPGKYFAAFSEKASLDNEQNAVVMRAADGRLLVFVQIAGFIARRIVCRVAAGDRCRRGQRVGMIKLGSRVDIYVPGRVTLRVGPGDRVTAGVTVLGELS